MSKTPITVKQKEVLDFIKQEIIHKGYPPSVRDICDAVQLRSTSSVHSHLETLERKGYIRRNSSKPRAIEILDDEFNGIHRKDMINIPIVGTVAAGVPLLAQENIEGYIPFLTDTLPNNKEMFILNVKGDSMIKCGIFNGDKIIVEKKSTAENGEIIVALIDDSATVKRFYKEKNHIRLQPENDRLDPIIVPDVTILGKVIGLLRLNII